VYIVVLNWNGWIDTLRCLQCIDQLDYPNYRVLIVDNGSTDGSEQRLEDARPDLTLIQTGSNLGYGGGNNVGVRRALVDGADYVWILNNDTEVPVDSLRVLVDAMQLDPQIGVLGIEAYDPQTGSPIALAPVPGVDQPLERSASSSNDVNLTNLVGAGVGEALSGHAGPLRSGRQPSTVRSVEYVHGSCLLARREVLEDLKGFDLRYFHFWEDIDFCWRARQAGWTVACLDSCRIVHRSGTSTAGASALRMYYTLRNLLIFAASASGLSVARYMLTPPGFRIWAPCVLGIRGFLRPRFKAAIFRAILHASRGIVGRCKTYSPS
jgi:GT2 family glycosyltransferase